mmetsp:Transcript_10799/g.27922  ORF Transcript_10799/g.27922 Transcript_10799/m.27922 type:complete len:328 (-) Transcript_10799:157-1140(-)
MDQFDVTVINTFVHLSEGPSAAEVASAGRRCTSVPSSLRLAGGPPSASSSVAAKKTAEVVSTRWSDVSTSADSISDYESVTSSPKHVPTDCRSTPHRGSPAAAEAASAAATPRPRTSPKPKQPNDRQQGARQRLQPPAPPTLGNGHAARGQSGAQEVNGRGSRSAAAPAAVAKFLAAGTGGAGGAGGAGAELLGQLAVVVAAMAAALSGCEHVKSAKTTQGARGWSVVAKVAAEDSKHKESALEAAREALLQAARASGCVYVLGHRAEPFLSTPVGFAASLGMVADDSTACWSMINQGFCRRGCACRFQHPLHQTTINVMVQVERNT